MSWSYPLCVSDHAAHLMVKCMKFVFMTHSTLSLTWCAPISHHPKSATPVLTAQPGSHSHVRWLLRARGWLARYLLDESRQRGRKGGAGLALPLHGESLSTHFTITTVCQEQAQLNPCLIQFAAEARVTHPCPGTSPKCSHSSQARLLQQICL